MRISFRYKYVMFDVPKSASTSINFALRNVSECILDGSGGVKHMNVADYEEYFEPFLKKCGGLDTDDLERIAVVREPFDMLASLYKYLRRSGVENPAHRDHFRHTCSISFSEFLEEVCERQAKTRLVTQTSSFILGVKGIVGIDSLFPFERLDDLAGYLSNKVGQEIEIPRRNVSVHQDIEPVEPSLRDQVQKLFENDFVLHDAIMRSPLGQPLRIRHCAISELSI